MNTPLRRVIFAFAFFAFLLASGTALLHAQSGSNHGTVLGSVTDPTGAVVPGAKVSILNPVSGFTRSAVSDGAGHYEFANVPFDPYHLTISAQGFNAYASDVEVRSAVPLSVTNALTVGGNSTVISVDASDLIRNDTSLQTSIDRDAFAKVPLESQSSSLSSLVTLSSPGVAADSNGLFHGLGDHASNSFSIDGQPITDQQSKVFSNQLPSNAVQSIRSSPALRRPSLAARPRWSLRSPPAPASASPSPPAASPPPTAPSGRPTAVLRPQLRRQELGQLRRGRRPQHRPLPRSPRVHRLPRQGQRAERLRPHRPPVHAAATRSTSNLNYSRSWFQTPNAFDNLNVQNVVAGGTSADPAFGNVGNTDQRSKIQTFNIAPTYTRVLSTNAVFNFGAFVRKDAYNYYPSGNPLADLGPPNCRPPPSPSSVRLTNTGLHTDFSYVKGINNVKIGGNYAQTFLRENDQLGVVETTYNSPCVDANGNPLPGYASSNPVRRRTTPNPRPTTPSWLPTTLPAAAADYMYNGHTDVKEIALYAEDQITAQAMALQRRHPRRPLQRSHRARQAEPRVGLSYTIKQTNTVLRASYARTLETPFNENLVLSSQGCSNDVLSPLLLCSPGSSGTLQPGYRNEFHAGLNRPSGSIWSSAATTSGSTPTTPSTSRSSATRPSPSPSTGTTPRSPAMRCAPMCPTSTTSPPMWSCRSVAARFFGPQVAGAGATPAEAGNTYYPFRIDHDEKFNETTHLQYQIPTSQHSCPGCTLGLGSASTGAMIAAWSPARCPATTRPPTIPTPPAA